MDAFKEGKRIAFEEFKLFYDSAEKVTDRRLSANRWNYSICIAIIGAIAVIVNWSISKPLFLFTGVAVVMLLALMAMLYCSLWIGQIRDLKELNNAKFSVMDKMAEYVVFGEGYNDNVISCKPFEQEWAVLKAAKIAQEVGSINIVALKSSNIEYLIPKAFRVFFFLVALITPFEAWRNYEYLQQQAVAQQVDTSVEEKSNMPQLDRSTQGDKPMAQPEVVK